MTDVTYRLVAAEHEFGPGAVGAPQAREVELDPAARYTVLPPHVAVDEMIEVKSVATAPDPEMGRNTETEFMIRYGAAGG